MKTKRIRVLILVLVGTAVALLAVLLLLKGLRQRAADRDAASAPDFSGLPAGFLKASGTQLVNGAGEKILLQGVNIGGWFVQEFWMTPTEASDRVACQKELEEMLVQRFGEDRAAVLLDTYLDHYFTEKDFDNIRDTGFNCIRLPFWYGTFTDADGNFREEAFARTDWFIEEAAKRNLYVILDLHGAYGSQNGSDHSGIDGREDKMGASAFFFGAQAEVNQELTYTLWEEIAAHYRGNPAVAGYDVLNEPFCTYRYDSGMKDSELHELLFPVYDTVYRRIRAADPDHLILFEAVWDAEDLPDPGAYKWENVMYEYHNYEFSHYSNENNAQVRSLKKKIRNIDHHFNVPSYMGEFTLFNEMKAWEDGIRLLQKEGISWTFWTYKCMTSNDNWGIQRLDIPKVNAETDSYEEILEKWSRTGDSTENRALRETLKKILSE